MQPAIMQIPWVRLSS